MNYPVQVDVRPADGAPGLDALPRERAASLLSGALSAVAEAGRPGRLGAGLAGFRVTAHAEGALLALSLDAPEPGLAQRAARQIADRVLPLGIRYAVTRWAGRGGLACPHWWLPPEPGLVQDRDELRRVLLAGPWELDTGAARWIAAAGLGLLRNRL